MQTQKMVSHTKMFKKVVGQIGRFPKRGAGTNGSLANLRVPCWWLPFVRRD